MLKTKFPYTLAEIRQAMKRAQNNRMFTQAFIIKTVNGKYFTITCEHSMSVLLNMAIR